MCGSVALLEGGCQAADLLLVAILSTHLSRVNIHCKQRLELILVGNQVMDHLPYPDDASLPALRIPYLCADVEHYDDRGFRDFPTRIGWNDTTQWSTCQTARIQSWLYFGLLAELFGSSFEIKQFIENSANGTQFVTTKRLPAILRHHCGENSRLYQSMASMGFRDKSQKGYLRGRPYVRLDERITFALGMAREQCDLLDLEVPSARLIALSINILIWSIGNALCTYWPSRKQVKEYKPRPDRFLRSRMLDGRKCPYWTEVFLQKYSAAMVYYLAALPSLHSDVDHSDCSAKQCTAHDINEQLYTTKHVQADCPCDMVTPDTAKIVSIIEKNGVPLVKLRELPSGLIALDVVEGRYGQHYTAISHVWSGGLGNPSSNSLPQCQLRSIRRGTFISKGPG